VVSKISELFPAGNTLMFIRSFVSTAGDVVRATLVTVWCNHRELIWYDTRWGLIGSCQVSLDGFASETSRSPAVRVELLLNTEELVIFLKQIRVWPTVGEIWRLHPRRVMIDHAPTWSFHIMFVWKQQQFGDEINTAFLSLWVGELLESGERFFLEEFTIVFGLITVLSLTIRIGDAFVKHVGFCRKAKIKGKCDAYRRAHIRTVQSIWSRTDLAVIVFLLQNAERKRKNLNITTQSYSS